MSFAEAIRDADLQDRHFIAAHSFINKARLDLFTFTAHACSVLKGFGMISYQLFYPLT
jgi:hypothetical protein